MRQWQLSLTVVSIISIQNPVFPSHSTNYSKISSASYMAYMAPGQEIVWANFRSYVRHQIFFLKVSHSLSISILTIQSHHK